MINDECLDEILRHYAIFRELPRQALETVRSETQPMHAAAGSLLFDVGDMCRTLPLLTEGTIKVQRVDMSGRQIRLYDLKPGDSCILSVSGLLGGSNYSALGVAATEITGAAIPRHSFVHLINHFEPFRRYIFRFFSERVTQLMFLIEDLAWRNLRQRLAQALATGPTPLYLTHQELTTKMGTVREVISRTLKEYETEGLVKLGRGRIDVLDATILKRIADM